MNQIELQKATGDIFYEAHMLLVTYNDCWARSATNPPIQASGLDAQFVRNCILEATLVHVRCLLDFLEKTRKRPANVPRKEFNPPKKDDVLAEDYGFEAKRIPIRIDIRQRINTSIAHLSYGRTRLTQEQRYWDWPAFIPEILKRSGEFFDHLVKIGNSRSEYISDERLAQFRAYASANIQ